MFSHRDYLNKNCPNCGGIPNYKITKIIDSRGMARYPYYCAHCGTRTQLFEKKKNLPKEILEQDPVLILPLKQGTCARCKEYKIVEEHHWAPRKYFNDADNWPKSMLCRSCHEEWHQVMTGDLIRRHPT